MRNKFVLHFLLLACSFCLAIVGPAFGQVTDDAPSAPEVSPTLVISQANGGGGASGTYLFDYVEIKNVSGINQSLNGLSLYYGSATGNFASSASDAFALPNVSLTPGQYYLVQLGPTGTAGAALPTPDATTGNLNMDGTSGKVALVITSTFPQNTCGATAKPCALPNSGIIDLVSWGASNNAEGNAPTNGGAALVSTQGNVRNGGGCTDTDNNNADVAIVSNPVPRNTASAVAICGAAATTAPTVFTAYLNGTSEVPANASAGTGFGRVVLNAAETQITASFYWKGLGSSANAGHIHGASRPGVNSGVLFPMGTVTGTTGAVTDVVFNVTATNVANLRAGLFYFNIHTTALPGGEIRGQIMPIRTKADYNGDGKADYGVVRQGAGGGAGQQTWYIQLNGGTDIRREWGLNSDILAPADYDGDGKTDIAVWRQLPLPGGTPPTLYILRSSDNTFQFAQFGLPGDIPIPADYTGDGKADFAIYRSGTAEFWYNPSSGPFVGHPVDVPWGAPGDTFVRGDFNGDGRADFCYIRSVGGIESFNIRYGTDGPTALTDTVSYFGVAATDTPVEGDFDGDGKADLAVTRQESGNLVWYYLPSSGGQYQRVVWGLSSDLQVPGDYDGDGKTDVAVWRPSNTPGASAFYVLGSQAGFLFQQWGIGNSDTPVNFDVQQ